ncbi:MAG: TonB-dependent receptor [Bacteroidales bacterium]
MKKSLLFLSAFVAVQTFSYAQSDAAKRDTSRFSNNVALDEVVVTATRAMKGTPVAYTNFSKEQIAERNFGQDVPYLISQTPSVIVTSDAGTGIGYTGFRVRGTDANRINITVNGVPMNDSESHTVFWVNMPDFASSVENVQIQRGVGTSTNGAASFGATIAMQTQGMSYKPYAEVSTAGGSFGTFKTTGKVSTGLLKNNFVFDARASHIQSDGFIDRASANMNSYYASGAWYGENTMLKFQTFGSKEKTYQSWNGVSSAQLENDRTFNSCGMYVDENGVTRFYDNQTDNYQQQHYHLMATQRVGDYWNMNATLHYTRGKGYYEDYKPNSKFSSYKLPVFTDQDGNEIKRSDLIRQKWLDNHFYGAVYSANYRKDNWHLTLGAAANKYDGAHFGKVIWVKNAMNLTPDHEYYRSNGDKLDYNAFAKLNVMLTQGLNGYVDLQYRGIDYRMKGEDDKAGLLDIEKNYNFFNPKFGLNYAFAKNHNAFVSFSIANREPNRNNFTEAAENERPTYETLYDYEAGYEYRTNRFHVGANLYFMDYNNQLILTGKISEIGEALTSNIKDSYRTGIELMGGVRIAKWLNWEGNMTLSQNKIKNFTEFVDDWDTGEQVVNHLGKTTIAFSPDIIANSMFNFGYKGFSASFNSSFVGRQYLDNTASEDRSIDPYFVNNIRFGYTFKPKFMETITVDFTVNNLFNEQYETNGWVYSYYEGGERKKDDGYFTQAGTNVMGRLVLRF